MYTKKEIELILQNKNVVKCSAKSITYSPEFKLKAIKQYYEEGYSPKVIFEEAGFDLSIITYSKIENSLRRWKILYKKMEKNLY